MPSKLHYEINKVRGILENQTIYNESIADLSNKYDALLLRIELVENLLLNLEAKL